MALFNKPKYEDEKRPISSFQALLIFIAVIAVLIIGFDYFSDKLDEIEIQRQGVEYVRGDY